MFKTPQDLEAACNDYFEKSDHPTICGLALALGFSDRQSIYDYREKPEFTCIIKRAMLKVENSYEERLAENGCTGSIFALKNMGWRDKQEIDHTTQGEKITRIERVVIDGADAKD